VKCGQLILIAKGGSESHCYTQVGHGFIILTVKGNVRLVRPLTDCNIGKS
jgi:hypothetical protein